MSKTSCRFFISTHSNFAFILPPITVRDLNYSGWLIEIINFSHVGKLKWPWKGFAVEDDAVSKCDLDKERPPTKNYYWKPKT